jgi:hypothetical protein
MTESCILPYSISWLLSHYQVYSCSNYSSYKSFFSIYQLIYLRVSLKRQNFQFTIFCACWYP